MDKFQFSGAYFWKEISIEYNQHMNAIFFNFLNLELKSLWRNIVKNIYFSVILYIYSILLVVLKLYGNLNLNFWNLNEISNRYIDQIFQDGVRVDFANLHRLVLKSKSSCWLRYSLNSDRKLTFFVSFYQNLSRF